MDNKNPKVFYMLHRMHQALFRASDRSLQKQLGITSVQSAVLMHLLGGRASIGDIADVLGQKMSSVSGLIDRMCSKELVTRVVSPTDARTVIIELTPTGNGLAKRALSIVRQTNNRLLEQIAEHVDVEAFAAACEAITKNANQTIEGAYNAPERQTIEDLVRIV